MIGSILFTVGGWFFSILLAVLYLIRSKQTGVKNEIYMMLIWIVMPVILTKLLALAIIFYVPNNPEIGNFFAWIHAFFIISWMMLACGYLLTIDHGQKVFTFKDYMQKPCFKVMLITFIIVLIPTFFLKFDNVILTNGVYMSGPAFKYLFVSSVIYIITTIYVALKKENKGIQKTTLVIGMFILVCCIVLQVVLPVLLVTTTFLVFQLFLLYFAYENPDLYLIKELEISKKKAETSNSAKTDFLSNMSHEIRTPMNAILGFSEGILNEQEFDEAIARKDVAHIYAAGSNLLEIINNILDISKIETGEEKLELKEYSMGSVVLELKSIIESRISNSKIKFVTNVDPNIPSKLLGDKTKIFQVLLNILSNSVKYTEVGKINLTISSTLKNNEVFLKIKISDTGFGIKKEDYEKIFEKFSRLDNATKNEIEGTGLGLVITKRLINLMGGKIWFDSAYGAGTNFYIEITQQIVDKTPLGDIMIERSIADDYNYIDCSGYKVLIVDDNKLNLMVASRVLSPYKFSITTLNNGKDCVNNIKEGNEYDIIFLDHMMPKMDGIEVLHILHKLEGYNIPPIVALTANAITGSKEMYLKEGFNEYLPKPINIGDLDKLINKYFAHKSKGSIKKEEFYENDATEILDVDEINNKFKELETNSMEEETIDNTSILKENGIDVEGALSFVGNMENYNDMIKEFYEEVDDKIKQLEEAKDNNDMPNYAIVVHSLKSDCRFLGITKFADQAYEQELKSKEGDIEFINDHYYDLVISKNKTKEIIKKYLEI